MKPGQRIKQVIEEIALTQVEFANSIGVHPASVSAVISGRNGTSRPLANSIELVHGYSAEWILTGEGSKKAIPRRYLEKNDQEVWELLNGLDSKKLIQFVEQFERFKAKVEQVRKD